MSTENKKRLKAIIIVSGILIIAVISFGAMNYTSKTGFCNSCHEMNPAFAGWESGFHGGIHCYDCHTDKGFIETVKVKANGLREVYIHFTRDVNMDEVKSEVPDRRCVECHNFEQKDKYIERVANFHLQHKEFKFDCRSCHGDVGHSNAKFIGFKNEACSRCHQSSGLDVPSSYIKKI